jgi:hypothetical protein
MPAGSRSSTASTSRGRPTQSTCPIPPLPDKKDVHYDVVKQEADEYQAVLAVGYDQEALTH